jgi:hypothetical protein
MDDQRVWAFEESLWTASAEHYQESIDQGCLMVVPAPPYVLEGQQAIDAVKDTPRWSKVVFSEQKVSRPQEGLIVIAYKAEAEKGGAAPYRLIARPFTGASSMMCGRSSSTSKRRR